MSVMDIAALFSEPNPRIGSWLLRAANSPVLYAPAAGSVQWLAKPGEAVKKNQVPGIVDSPDQERATGSLSCSG